LDEDGDWLQVQGDTSFVGGLDSIVSDIHARFRFFKGEWFLDTEFGVPYFSEVLVKAPVLNAIREVFLKVIRGTPGVSEVTRLELVYDGANRSLSVAFRAKSDLGELIVDTINVPVL